MQFRVGKSKKQGQYWSALCYHHYKDGSKCEQKGKVLDEELFDALYERIINIDPNMLQEIELQGRGYNDTKTMIAVKEQELQKHKRALDKLHESFEEDMLTKQVFMERKVVRTRQIQKLEEELQNLRKMVVDESSNPTVEQIVERIAQFRELWDVAGMQDTTGNAFNVCLSYVKVKDFGSFWDRYCNYVKTRKYPVMLVSSDINADKDYSYSDIRFMTTTHIVRENLHASIIYA